MVLKWADTEPGNVELLAMRTFSETILEPATTTEEEIKKEDTNEEVTAGTFGFQGEVINNEEIIMVRCMHECGDSSLSVCVGGVQRCRHRDKATS